VTASTLCVPPKMLQVYGIKTESRDKTHKSSGRVRDKRDGLRRGPSNTGCSPEFVTLKDDTEKEEKRETIPNPQQTPSSPAQGKANPHASRRRL